MEPDYVAAYMYLQARESAGVAPLAGGRDGQAPFCWERAVPDLVFTYVFETVTLRNRTLKTPVPRIECWECAPPRPPCASCLLAFFLVLGCFKGRVSKPFTINVFNAKYLRAPPIPLVSRLAS